MTINHNIFKLILQKIDDIYLKEHINKFKRTLINIDCTYTIVLDSNRHIFFNRFIYNYNRYSIDKFHRNPKLEDGRICYNCNRKFPYRSEMKLHKKSLSHLLMSFIKKEYIYEITYIVGFTCAYFFMKNYIGRIFYGKGTTDKILDIFR